MAERLKIAGIILAAGSGTRMHSAEKKQFMELEGLPVFAWSLLAFEENPAVDSLVLVMSPGDLERAVQICDRLRISKIKTIIAGGDQRFKSVFEGLRSIRPDTDYVLIHDAARPVLTQKVLGNCIEGVLKHQACVAAVREKNTIKRADAEGFAEETIDRGSLFEVQTPQAFSFRLIVEAYYRLMKTISEYQPDVSRITDDAVIVENMTDCRVALVEGDYRNIKITTPEDMIIAGALLRSLKTRPGENAPGQEKQGG